MTISLICAAYGCDDKTLRNLTQRIPFRRFRRGKVDHYTEDDAKIILVCYELHRAGVPTSDLQKFAMGDGIVWIRGRTARVQLTAAVRVEIRV